MPTLTCQLGDPMSYASQFSSERLYTTTPAEIERFASKAGWYVDIKPLAEIQAFRDDSGEIVFLTRRVVCERQAVGGNVQKLESGGLVVQHGHFRMGPFAIAALPADDSPIEIELLKASVKSITTERVFLASRATASAVPIEDVQQQQYHHLSLGVPEAWKRTQGAGATLAVVDVEFDLQTECLRQSVTHGGFLWDEGSGQYDAVDVGHFPRASWSAHGTECAALAVGKRDTPLAGIHGVAPLSIVIPMAMGMLPCQERLAQALWEVVALPQNKRPSVVSVSISPDESRGVLHLKPVLENALDLCAAAGVLVCVAVSNWSGAPVNLDELASSAAVLAVAAVNQNDVETGACPAGVAAPVVGALSASVDGTVVMLSAHNSYGCPVVAGVALLLYSARPMARVADVVRTLKNSASRCTVSGVPIVSASQALSGW